jgi:uncharacterized protein with NRDE domain
MCTVILAHRVLDDAPILFGANRDESLKRPSEPPTRRDGDPLAVVAPRDLKAGGTWLGVNSADMLAAITNRFGKPADPARRSRGELVDRALEHPTAAEAADAITALEATDYNPFHLVCVDPNDAHLIYSNGQTLTRSALRPGLLVLTERSLGAADNKRKERVLGECRALLDAGELDEAHLQQILSRCDDGSIDATCVRLDGLDYGTRSSTIIRLGDVRRLLHAEGPPCATDYTDLSGLIR